jgi:hypothetical protein
MTYNTIADMRDDSALRRRLVACAAQEDKEGPSPESWVSDHIWDIVASPGWEAAWEYAEAADKENIGADETVISDAMILAVIQPMDAPAPPEEPEVTPPIDIEDVPST